MATSTRKILPGFSLSLGYTMLYMSLLMLIPLAACFTAWRMLVLARMT